VGPASVAGAAAFPCFHILLVQEEPWSAGHLPLTAFLIVLGLLVIVRHRSNLAKLRGALRGRGATGTGA
jgi:hypothetical protein